MYTRIHVYIHIYTHSVSLFLSHKNACIYKIRDTNSHKHTQRTPMMWTEVNCTFCYPPSTTPPHPPPIYPDMQT